MELSNPILCSLQCSLGSDPLFWDFLFFLYLKTPVPSDQYLLGTSCFIFEPYVEEMASN